MSKAASAIKKQLYLLSTRLLRGWYRGFWGMDIGREVRIARSARLDTTNPRGLHIGDYTAVSFDAAILTHDFVNYRHVETRIGSCCLIGARSVILPGVTIGDHCIVGAGSVVVSDIPPRSLVSGNPARLVERDIQTGKWGIRAAHFLARPDSGAAPAVEKATRAISASTTPATTKSAGLDQLLALAPADHGASLAGLGFDSFALVTMRAEIEARLGTAIDDAQWIEVETPADILKLLPAGSAAATVAKPPAAPPAAPPPAAAPAAATDAPSPRRIRHHDIGMPQMVAAGLSEGWLLKELGDLHWDILTRSLGVASRDIADAGGERLYATFTAIRLRLGQALSDILENDRLTIDMTMSRFGAGMFFSTASLTTNRAAGDVSIMSNFSKFEKPGQNDLLVRGQPHLPPGFVVPLLEAAPPIVDVYRGVRSAGAPEPLVFETDYELQPYHDINGVGLLYFAAYPIIHDVCLRRHFGGDDWREWTTIDRDIFYFANSGAGASIRFRLHSVVEDGDRRSIVATLSRISDGKLMARLETTQKRTAPASAAE